MLSLVAALVLSAAPPTGARPVRVVRCDDGPCLELRFLGSDSKRVTLGAGALATLREAFPHSEREALEALLGALELAAKKRKLRPAALRIAEQVADSGAVSLLLEEPGVRLEGETLTHLRRVAARYFRATARRAVVTSGTRTPLEQADAMYAKVRYGGSLGIYKDRDVVKRLKAAAKAARRAGGGREEVVRAMAAIVEAELRRGNPISRHLVRGAADLRSTGLGGSDKKALRAAILAEPGAKLLVERRPPHFHVSFD